MIYISSLSPCSTLFLSQSANLSFYLSVCPPFLDGSGVAFWLYAPKKSSLFLSASLASFPVLKARFFFFLCLTYVVKRECASFTASVRPSVGPNDTPSLSVFHIFHYFRPLLNDARRRNHRESYPGHQRTVVWNKQE